MVNGCASQKSEPMIKGFSHVMHNAAFLSII